MAYFMRQSLVECAVVSELASRVEVQGARASVRQAAVMVPGPGGLEMGSFPIPGLLPIQAFKHVSRA